MKNNKLATAALAGLFATTMMVASNSFADDSAKASCNGKKMEKANCKTADGKEKHACKGKNSCKNQGASGKNSCKGKGSCRTDSQE